MMRKEEVGRLAMLRAVATKVDSMRQTAHDNALRQEGGAAALLMAVERAQQLQADSPLEDAVRCHERWVGLLNNMAQSAQVAMHQQAGRCLQAADVLAACRTLAEPEKSADRA